MPTGRNAAGGAGRSRHLRANRTQRRHDDWLAHAAHLTRLVSALAGRYRLDGELGTGGMATVWLAEDLRHNRRVAIKALHPELSAVLGPERLLAEIRATANLQHPHILPLFDSGSTGGCCTTVMPQVEDETTRARRASLLGECAIEVVSRAGLWADYEHQLGLGDVFAWLSASSSKASRPAGG